MSVPNVFGRQLGNTEFNRPASRVLHQVLKELLDPYHPERHYMRGPGPRWHQKHSLIRLRPGDVRIKGRRPCINSTVPAKTHYPEQERKS
jgi:hypothetical protein